jgi:uncharacterized RDD family membrane protein YckC
VNPLTHDERTELEPATFWIRAGARLIDYAVIFFIMLVTISVAAFIATVFEAGLFMAALEKDTRLITWVFGAITLIGYHSMYEGVTGTTIGKRLTGLQVISNEPGPLTMKQAFLRSIAFVGDAFFFGAVGAAKMRSNPEQQRHGDEWADTRVVIRKSLPARFHAHGFDMFAATIAAFCVTSAITVLQQSFEYMLLLNKS